MFCKTERSVYQSVQSVVTGSYKKYAAPSNRKKRGLYRDNTETYNADAVGAFNILRKYLSVTGKQKELSVKGLKNPEIIKVAV